MASGVSKTSAARRAMRSSGSRRCSLSAPLQRNESELRQYGYSRVKRGDCRQVVIALIVTPEGFPLSCEVLAGNTADSTTLSASWTASSDATGTPTASG